MAANKIVVNDETIIDLTGDSVTPETLLQGATAHDASGAAITGTLDVPAAVERATPVINLSTTGLVTASVTQPAGVVSSGTKRSTMQLRTKAANTIMPASYNQTAVSRGYYTIGAISVLGSPNLIPENIRKGKEIFAVQGAYTGEIEFKITVSAATGATVTATKEDLSVSGTSVDGMCTLVVPEAGTWTVSAALDGKPSIKVPVEVIETYSASLTFPNVFGVTWDTNSLSSTLTRLSPTDDPNGFVTVAITSEPSPAIGTGSGSSPFDNYAPWSGMVECNVADGHYGVSVYKKGDSVFSYDEDTFVYIPEFYYKVIYDEDAGKCYYYISDIEVPEFEKHPGSGRYVSRYLMNDQYVSSSEYSGIVMLYSESMQTVRTGLSNYSENGIAYIYDFATHCAIQLLYLIEFADWNSQAKIGAGEGDGDIQYPGKTDSMYYHTGVSTDGYAVQYRGIENLWIGMKFMVDGITIMSGAVYIATDPKLYGSKKTTGYTFYGRSLSSRNFYIKNFDTSTEAGFSWAFIPKYMSTNGSATTYVTDMQETGAPVDWKCLRVGGSEMAHDKFGLFYFNFIDESEIDTFYTGYRKILVGVKAPE